ncbi:probable RNA-binding protein 18 isoform X3 [Gigantopelta aegis]|uniref:probable RNA-binding protein 18 isoform X3 n=1 Tax=Gigantopelta aegis TaxID=1735272 RepID=UPI001B88AFC1|nr:probable RNA-binding protein 18 isoform X3 [Gigantopelta aegis]
MAVQEPGCSIPVPVSQELGDESDYRLWIGNLDSRITEFTLLKLVQKFGDLKKFDFLYHKEGPDVGKPRGYCFVSFNKKQVAERAIKGLDGKLALSQRLVVRWARAQKPELAFCKSTSVTNEACSNLSEAKIKIIEARLKMMENKKEEFEISTKPTAPPGSSKLSMANVEVVRKQRTLTLKNSQSTLRNSHLGRRPQNSEPYRNKRRK